MATSTDILVQGVIYGTGTYIGIKHVGPAIDKTVEVSAKKAQEVVQNHGNAMSSAAVCAGTGAVVAGPGGAFVGGLLGMLSGNDEDAKAKAKADAGGTDDRCIVM